MTPEGTTMSISDSTITDSTITGHGADHDCDECRSDVTRRGFMGVVGAGAAVLGWSTLGSSMAFATPEAPSTGDVLVVVFMRGGMDGLNVVAPYMMPTYRTLRPTIRVKDATEFTDPTGKAGLPLNSGGSVAAFPLSGTFALHPGMEPLHQGAWADGKLAVVHAAGLPASESSTRSHFDAEQYWERGSRSLSVTNGFLNRYLAGVPGANRLSAVGRGSNLQEMLHGSAPAFSMSSISGFGVRGFPNNTQARTALVGLYQHGSQLLDETGANTLDVVNLLASLPGGAGSQNGAVYGTDDLSYNLREVARLIRGNVGLRAVAIDYGGWDTHSDEGVPEDPNGYFHKKTNAVATAFQAFYKDLGTAMDEVTLVTMSEFGRTIDENGSLGTDHGRATAMFAMGGKVKGGVFGSFPTTIANGPEGDLSVLNDYRQVLSELLSVRCGATNLSSIFPTYAQQAPLGLALP
jgi:uncharacterized protein (DUF1501 family)